MNRMPPERDKRDFLAHRWNRTDWHAVLALSALTVALFAAGGVYRCLWASCEPLSAEIAREMYESGDYIVPHLNYRVRLTKPPVYHWLAAASYGAFGVNELTARLPSGLAALATVLVTFSLGRRMLGRAAGFIAAAMLAAGLEFSWNACCARTDMVFAFFTTAAMASFFFARQGGRRHRLLFAAAFAFTGLSLMTKGPLGPAVIVAAAGAHLWLAAGVKGLRKIPWVAGIAAFLIVSAPWHIAVFAKAPRTDSVFFVFGQMHEWFEEDVVGAGAGVLAIFQYIPYTLWGFFPWSFFLPTALWRATGAVRRRENRDLVLPLVWFAAGFVLLSVPRIKAARYMAPMYPAGAIMVAYVFRKATAAGNGQRRLPLGLLVPMTAVLVALAAVAAAAARGGGRIESLLLRTFDPYARVILTFWLGLSRAHLRVTFLIGLLACAVAAAGLVSLWRRKTNASLLSLAAINAVAAAVLYSALLPPLDPATNIRQFFTRLESASRGGPIAWTGPYVPESASFYLKRRMDGVAISDLGPYLDENPGAVVLIDEGALGELPGEITARTEVLFRDSYKVRMLAALRETDTPAPPAPE